MSRRCRASWFCRHHLSDLKASCLDDILEVPRTQPAHGLPKPAKRLCGNARSPSQPVAEDDIVVCPRTDAVGRQQSADLLDVQGILQRRLRVDASASPSRPMRMRVPRPSCRATCRPRRGTSTWLGPHEIAHRWRSPKSNVLNGPGSISPESSHRVARSSCATSARPSPWVSRICQFGASEQGDPRPCAPSGSLKPMGSHASSAIDSTPHDVRAGHHLVVAA